MKKAKFRKIPARAHAILGYAFVGVTFLASAVVLLFLVADVMPGNKRADIFFATFFLLALSAASFLIGCDWSKRLLQGRVVRFEELTWPGTALPQSRSFFRFHGAHELPNGWAVATFQKVAPRHCLKTSGWVSKRNLFSVLSKKEWLPERPCFVMLDFDQHEHIMATIILEQTPERN